MTPRRPGPPAGSPPQDITDPATGGSRLLSQRCATCILRPGDKMHLGPERLRAIITEALAAGTFVVCHDTLTYGDFPDYGPAICRGFYDAYAAQRYAEDWREQGNTGRPAGYGDGQAYRVPDGGAASFPYGGTPPEDRPQDREQRRRRWRS